jgi:hypothetical protein
VASKRQGQGKGALTYNVKAQEGLANKIAPANVNEGATLQRRTCAWLVKLCATVGGAKQLHSATLDAQEMPSFLVGPFYPSVE